MTTIESKKVVVASPAANVHDFLINTDNIQQLLPEGKITEWKSDGKQCSFKIQGAYTIGLRLIGSTPNTSVVYESTEGSPFSFNLNVHINETAGSCDTHLVCEANINPFLEMMVKGPLKNLFDYMADKLVTKVN
jgi:carbon monoxide dehydrogenase subunit G